MEERRREPRRIVNYPLTILRAQAGGETGEQSTAENINSRGVFFHLSHPLPVQSSVDLNIAIPPAGDWVMRALEVKAEGRVVRSAPATNSTPRFATAVEFTQPLTLRFEGVRG